MYMNLFVKTNMYSFIHSFIHLFLYLFIYLFFIFMSERNGLIGYGIY